MNISTVNHVFIMTLSARSSYFPCEKDKMGNRPLGDSKWAKQAYGGGRLWCMAGHTVISYLGAATDELKA